MCEGFFLFIFENCDDIKTYLNVQLVLDTILICSLDKQLHFGWCHEALRITEKGAISGLDFYHNNNGIFSLGNNINLCFLKSKIAFQNSVSFVQKITNGMLLAPVTKIIMCCQNFSLAVI